MQLLLQAGADANVKDEFSTPFKVAGKKRMRVMEGEFKTHFIVKCAHGYIFLTVFRCSAFAVQLRPGYAAQS